MKILFTTFFTFILFTSCSENASLNDLEAYSAYCDTYSLKIEDLNVEQLKEGFKLITTDNSIAKERGCAQRMLFKNDNYFFIGGKVEVHKLNLSVIDSINNSYWQTNKDIDRISFYDKFILISYYEKGKTHFSIMDLKSDTIKLDNAINK